VNGGGTPQERRSIGGDRTVTALDAREDWRFGHWRPEIERFVRHRGTVTLRQVADRFHINRHMAAGRLDRMLKEGTIERAGKGLYRVKEAGPC